MADAYFLAKARGFSDGEDLFKNVKFNFGPDINNTEDRIEE